MRRNPPHTPGRSRFGALAAIVAVFTVLLAPAPQAAAELNDLSPAGVRALEDITACLQARPLLAVSVVIDESASLKRVDPADSRAEILGQFLRRIASFSEGTLDGREREVHLNLGYFGSGYSESLPWTELDERNSERIIAEAVEETARRKEALHTRYQFAIDDTRRAIEDISARLPARDLCTLVVWFSDGELDPENNPSGAPDRPAVLEATEELCRADGLLDQLRATGTPLVGILLDSEFIDRSGTPIPRMREMVEGDGPGGRCGARPGSGVYLQGALDSLFRMFERVAAESEGATRLGAFAGDPIEFPVDGGVGRIRIVGPAEGGFELTSASGRTLEAQDGQPNRGDLAGVSVTTWTGGSVSVDVTVQQDYGTWRIVRAGEQGEIDVYYFGDLDIVPDLEATRLLREAPSTIVGSVLRLDGTSIRIDDFSDLSLTIDTGSGPLPVELSADGRFTADVEVRTDEASLPVRFRLAAVTERGLSLQPVVRQRLIPVTLPEEFPTVDFAAGSRFTPELQRLETSSRLPLELIGSPLGPTRVCITGVDAGSRIRPGLDGVDGSGCVELSAGEVREVVVTGELRELLLERAVSEVVIATTLTSAPVDGRGPVEITKILRADAEIIPPPPNEWVRWLLLVLGILLPLAGLMIANHRAARFSTHDLQVARIPVMIEGDSAPLRIRRADPAGAPLLDDRDFSYLNVDSDGSRAIDLPGATLRTRTPFNPFGSIRAEVHAQPGSRVVSNREPSTVPDGRRAGMDLMPQRDAFLLIGDDALRADPGVPVPATLMAFLTPTLSGDREQLARVTDDVDGKLIDPERLAQLRASAAVPDEAHSKSSVAATTSAGATSSVPPLAFGDGFDDGFGAAPRSSGDAFGASSAAAPQSAPPSGAPAPPPPPPAPRPPSNDPGDNAWGSGPSGSNDVWD